jgi:NAD(P)-dependent dehydrogenase (short-subunit alcohol dehydrogenase family)
MRQRAHLGERAAVVVTGAAGGIGAATSRRLAGDGHVVIMADRDRDALHAAAEAIVASGGRAVAVVGDVTSPDDCARIAECADDVGAPLRGLVNNAAVGAFNMSVETTSFEEWQRVIAVNLTSVYLMSRVCIPRIRAAGGGAIVNVSSIHAAATSTAVAPYAAAKGGVLALTRTMALDLAVDHIRVVCVVPGAVDTPMLRSHADRQGVSVAELGFPSGSSAIGRIAAPDELAGVIAFALSADATFVTGSALVADGGILAKF